MALAFAAGLDAAGVGTAFFRDAGLELLSIPVVVVMLGVIEMALGPEIPQVASSALRFLGFDVPEVSAGGAVGTALALTTAASTLTWMLVRDMPVRNRSL